MLRVFIFLEARKRASVLAAAKAEVSGHVRVSVGFAARAGRHINKFLCHAEGPGHLTWLDLVGLAVDCAMCHQPAMDHGCLIGGFYNRFRSSPPKHARYGLRCTSEPTLR